MPLLNECFQCASDSRYLMFVTGLCGGLNGLLAICDGVGEENWELSGS